MAGMEALQSYGDVSSDSDEESSPTNEESSLHLKPVESSLSTSKSLVVASAPVVATKVN